MGTKFNTKWILGIEATEHTSNDIYGFKNFVLRGTRSVTVTICGYKVTSTEGKGTIRIVTEYGPMVVLDVYYVPGYPNVLSKSKLVYNGCAIKHCESYSTIWVEVLYNGFNMTKAITLFYQENEEFTTHTLSGYNSTEIETGQQVPFHQTAHSVLAIDQGTTINNSDHTYDTDNDSLPPLVE